MSQFTLAHDLINQLTERDLEDGTLTRLQLRVIKDPTGVAYWAPKDLEQHVDKTAEEQDLEE